MKDIDKMIGRIEILENKIKSMITDEERLRRLLMKNYKNICTRFTVIIVHEDDRTSETYDDMELEEVLGLSLQLTSMDEMTIKNEQGEIIYEE